MESVKPLPCDKLCWCCDPDSLPFQTTDDLQDLDEFVGQDRALDAVRFGIRIRREGYNMYVLGPPGVGKRTIVQAFLEQKAADEHRPYDWCYVNNFDEPHRPRSLQLPPGRGAQLVKDVDTLIDDLHTAIPTALEMEEHKTRVQQIEQEAKRQQETAMEALGEQAAEQDIQLVRTPSGIAFAPMRDGEVIEPDEYKKISEEEKQRIKKTVDQLQNDVQRVLDELPGIHREIRSRVRVLNRETAQRAIDDSIREVRQRYQDLPAVVEYLDAVEQDIIENVDDFRPNDEEPPAAHLPTRRGRISDGYGVNLIVDNAATKGAPVIFEEHPSYQNLLGRVEHESQMGTLVTDFSLIKPGALHRANGGYLCVEAVRVLQQPYAWEGLKRALYAGHIKIESLGEALSLISTTSLEPAPIPLDVKVVLLGDRMLYYLLYQHDPDFGELFKVAADFEESMDRTPETCLLYAQLIATLVHREEHRRFDRAAVARVLQHSARVVADSGKLTAHMRTVADLIREADYWASAEGADTVHSHHVQRAIDKQVGRADRIRRRVQEDILQGTLMIDTSGGRVGQVNGLSVLDLGNFAFGRPSRITAPTRLGKGDVVDIEREVELGGSLHSKGVLILSSLLASRYAAEQPLSLSASLVFEQSYGMIDGDSASLAELCALLSSLSGLPIKQSLAVTGSIDQHGRVQPIGGVNEKIEGFFDVCRQRDLTGEQGVLIPSTNVRHLMLRADVVQACEEGRFHIYAVEDIDQALTLLTGVPAGQADAKGEFPADTVSFRVADRLRHLFQLRQKLSESNEKTEK